MIGNSPAVRIESPATYDREILAALRRIAWRDSERWVHIDIGDPWHFACHMPVPPEIGFSAVPRCEFVLDRLRALAESGQIHPAWREVEGRPRFGYVVPPREKRRAKVAIRAVARLTDSDRRFLAGLLIAWDAPAERAASAAGGRGAATGNRRAVSGAAEQ